MVKSVLSVNHQGLRDWLFQRITAVVMVVYTFLLIGFFVSHSPVDFTAWHNFYTNFPVKVATLLLIASILYHAWCGMWIVLTDYVKPFVLRLVLEILILLSLIAFFFAGLMILWGV